jgi:hypothetical protein
MTVDDVIHRRIQVLAIIRRSHVHNLCGGRHAMHSLDIERLLGPPPLRVLALILRSVVNARRHDLN